MLPSKTPVLILAAGRGERMRPLTDTCPKPLLNVGERSLIEHHLIRLKDSGFENIIINIDHLGQQIIDRLGNGEQFGLNIQYSDERCSGALETAGGIKKALNEISDTISKATNSIVVINGDVWTDFDFKNLLESKNKHAIVLTENPKHNLKGDFTAVNIDNKTNQNTLLAKRIGSNLLSKTYTFAGIGIYSIQLFDDIPKASKTPLAPLLFSAADSNDLEAIIHTGIWTDVGTPERLETICRDYRS